VVTIILFISWQALHDLDLSLPLFNRSAVNATMLPLDSKETHHFHQGLAPTLPLSRPGGPRAPFLSPPGSRYHPRHPLSPLGSCVDDCSHPVLCVQCVTHQTAQCGLFVCVIPCLCTGNRFVGFSNFPYCRICIDPAVNVTAANRPAGWINTRWASVTSAPCQFSVL
jgi:hypothetical protein